MHHIVEIAAIRPVTESSVMEWLTDHGITIRDALREAVQLSPEHREQVLAVLVNSGLIQAPTWAWCLDQLGLRFIDPLVSAVEHGLITPNIESASGITILEEILDRQMYASAEVFIRRGFQFSLAKGPDGENIFHRLARDGNTKGLKMLLAIRGSLKLLRSPNDVDMLPADVASDCDRHEFLETLTKHLDAQPV